MEKVYINSSMEFDGNTISIIDGFPHYTYPDREPTRINENPELKDQTDSPHGYGKVVRRDCNGWYLRSGPCNSCKTMGITGYETVTWVDLYTWKENGTIDDLCTTGWEPEILCSECDEMIANDE